MTFKNFCFLMIGLDTGIAWGCFNAGQTLLGLLWLGLVCSLLMVQAHFDA